MVYEIGTKVLSNAEVIGIPLNTEGVVEEVSYKATEYPLYTIAFGNTVRYLYEYEFFVLGDV